MKRETLWMKSIAALLVLTFSASQIVWAADVRQMLIDAKNFFSEQDAQRPHGMAASDLEAAQTQQQAAVDQQQLLQDFQNTTFNLTTANGDVLKYVGNKLDSVQRPDGTELAHIVTDAQGNIQNADLKLSDGSVQILQGGSVVGYQTPDGNQVFYTNGEVTKVINKAGVETLYTYLKDAQGNVTETTLDNAQYLTKYDANKRIKEATRKSDNQKITYLNGMIQKIVNGDGSQVLFSSQAVGTDILVTPQGQAAPTSYTDASGNKYSFDAQGNVTKIDLTDGSKLESITWDANGKANDGTLTEADGTKHIYQGKVLTRSYDAANVVTNYTYTATGILVAKAGATWEYLWDGTPVKYTNLVGDVTTYLQSGTYKGLRDKDVMATGQTFIYEYTGSGPSIVVQKREMQSTVLNVAIFDGWSYVAQASNPYAKTTIIFPNDGTVSQAVSFTAVNSSNTKKISMSLVSGTGSTYTWAGVTNSLGVTLNKGTSYKVEVVWEASRVGIYVYAATAAKPATPTTVITDRAWDPKFKFSATNATLTMDSSNSGYNKNATVWEAGYPSLGNNPALRFNFNLVNTSYKTLRFVLKNYPPPAYTLKQYDFFYNDKGVWTFTRTDAGTVVASSTLAQAYTPGVDYTAEIRLENGKMSLYVNPKGQARGAAIASFDSANFATMEVYTANASGLGTEYKNLTTPTVQSVTASALTSRSSLLSAGTFTKPAVPAGGSTGASDFASIKYDSASNLKEVTLNDGKRLVFSQGILQQAYDAAGNVTAFSFTQSSLSSVLGTSIVQNNLTSTYSADGKLSGIKTGDLTLHYKTDGTTVDWIEKTDGTELWDLVFDAAGNITGASIYAPTGEIRTYAAGKLVNLRQPDQSQLIYANDKVTQMVTPEKLTYNFDYTNPSIVVATLAGTPPIDTLTPIRMEYDTNFNLKKVMRQNQEVINYLNNQIDQIAQPNTAPKIFNYTRDAQGKVLSYTVTQGNILTYYDANNQPTRALISPDASNPNTLDISYQYGKIRQIKKNNAVTFTYSYSFEANGTELTVVEDLEENTTKTYRGGDLASSLDKTTNVLSSYDYASGKVSQVRVTRFGRSLHTYAYSYSGTNTVVQDEAGVIRTYDANQKLAFLERGGERFAYSYDTVQVQTGQTSPQPQESLLPMGIFDWTAMSTVPYSSQSWNFWGGSEKYLVTYWDDQWIEYKPVMGAAGDLVVRFEGSNSGGLPTNYANFDLAISIDGVSKGVYRLPASTAWQPGEIVITGLSAGQHTFRMTWTNEVWQDSTHDANFVYRNFSMSSRTLPPPQPVTQPSEIVTETLVEKRMSDGTLLHYASGRISQIDRTDGRIVRNIIEEDEKIKEVMVFENAQDTAGTKVEFANGDISRVTLVGGQQLVYSYDRDTNGNVVTTWLKKGAAVLKYDAQGNLSGMKIDGVMAPEEVRAASTHAYPQGYFGANSIDGNFSTSQWNSIGCAGVGGCGATTESQHTFPQPQTLTGITFQMSVSAYASGNYVRDHNASYYVEVLRNGAWQTVTGSSWGCGGGDGSCGTNSGVVNLAGLNLDNVTAIRAHANGFGNASGGEGNSGGSSNIYEIQYVLADLANLSFSKTTGAGGTVTGYTFTGNKGAFKYDAQGVLTQSNAAYAAIQQELTGLVHSIPALPFKSADFLGAQALMADSETVVTQEYSQDGTLETQAKADGTVTLFENNKPSKILDKKGEVLVQYSYDAQGNPTRVYLKNARDTLPDEVLKARQSIESQRAASLRNLAAQRNLAYQTIQNQYKDAQAALQSQLSQQETNFNNLSGNAARGKLAKSVKADSLGQIGAGIDSLRSQLIGLYDSEADAYAALDAQVKTLSDSIEADSAQAVTNLATQEANMKREILKQEVSPIVYDYYRRLLGRDPDTTEYNYWVSQIDYNSGATLTEVKTTAGTNLTAALSAYINAQPELSQRQAYVNAIKQAVTSQINSYLSMTQAQKEAFAATLGLAAQDLIPLSNTDATGILNWLNSRSLHFGQSAFLALESLLDQKGKTYTRETLAKQAILIDILTGVISPLDDGDLVISIFALNKVAGLYGVTLTGANVSWDDLKAIVPATSTATSPRVIAHINGNHYVIVTSMTATSITYVDPGIGKDKQNESVTVTKEGFLKAWQGNVTLNQADYSAVQARVASGQSGAKLLSSMESKNIRGAFWGSLLGLIGSVLSWIPGLNGIGLVLSAISAAVSAIEGDWMSAISSLVTLGVGSFGDVLKGAFDGVVKSMGPLGKVFSAAGDIIGGVFKAVTGLVGNISKSVGGFLQAIGIGSDLAVDIAQLAVSQGLRVGVSKGFEAVGVNPQISGFLGNLTSGAVMAGIAPQTQNESGKLVSRADMIKTSIQQAATIAQVGNFGMQIGLDPIFSRILGNSLAVIQGIAIQNPTTILDQAFSLVKKELKTSLTQYSLEKLGNGLGLNPLISTAIAAPIASNLANSLSTTKWTGQVATSANDGISVNTKQYRNESLGVNIAIAGPGTVERAWWDSVFGFLKNNVYMMAASAASAYYLTKPTLSSGGQVSAPTTAEMPIPAGATSLTYQDYFTGQSKAGYQINSSASNYIVYDRATGNPVKRVSNDVVEEGVFEGIVVLKADGSIAVDYRVHPDYVTKGQIKYTTDTGGQARFKIQDGAVQEICIDATSPDIVLNPGTTKDATNKVINGVVKVLKLGLELSVANGTPSKSTGGQQGSGELTKKLKRVFVFGNGFENERRPEDTPDPLIESYVLDLEGRTITSPKIINPAKKLMFYLYEMTDMVFNAVDWLTDFEPGVAYALLHLLEGPVGSVFETVDVLMSILSNPVLPDPVRAAVQKMRNYLAINWGVGNNLVQEVMLELDQKGPIEDGIAFVHSGATAPLLEALRLKPYDIQTVIVYEGPHPDYNQNLSNPNLERVIHVRGTGTVAEKDAFVPFLDWASFDNTANSKFENINIQILGAFHNDFTYIGSYWAANPPLNDAERTRERINRRTNLFMRDLYEAALRDQTEQNALNDFFTSLERTGAAKKVSGIWQIDPDFLRD